MFNDEKEIDSDICSGRGGSWGGGGTQHKRWCSCLNYTVCQELVLMAENDLFLTE